LKTDSTNSMKSSNYRFFRFSKTGFSALCLGLVLLSVTLSFGLASRSSAEDLKTFQNAQIEVPITQQICSAIYSGEFEKAATLIDSGADNADENIGKLSQVISQYEQLQQSREATRGEAYDKAVEALKKLQKAADVNGLGDVNDISSIFSVVRQIKEFANEKQKQKLLEDKFVTHVVDTAKTRAARFEAQGKWLDAYLYGYSWLREIFKDNKSYEDYAQQLLDKANIVASFQDSPCESSKERYEGVRKDMFKRAVNSLDFGYVEYPNYRAMAQKAIKRCKLLADVMHLSYDEIMKSQNSSLTDQQGSPFFIRPTDQQVSAWKSSLGGILDSLDKAVLGISKDKFLSIFDEVMLINTATIELPETVLIAQFSEAAFSALDPYTVMIWPRQVKDFEKAMGNKFTGIGIRITKEKGLLTAASLLPDTPAYNSGLDAGDVIQAVDGVETKDMSLGCAVKHITGPAGTQVTLTIKREGLEDPFDLTITRANIDVPTVMGWKRIESGQWEYFLDDNDKIAYVRLSSFSGKTGPDFERVLNKLESQGMKALILDLRYNSGGLLPTAIEVVDKFISKGLIVRTQPRYGLSSYASAKKKGTHPDYPLVILTNSDSASASEIVAGALQDKKYKRAVIVGQRTHGKGLVQGITSSPEGGAQLKYTMAYYHLPSGQRVESKDAMKKIGSDQWGIGPDVKLVLRSDEALKMVEVRWDNSVLVKADHDSNTKPLKKHTLKDTLDSDPQLQLALIVAKTKLVEADGVN